MSRSKNMKVPFLYGTIGAERTNFWYHHNPTPRRHMIIILNQANRLLSCLQHAKCSKILSKNQLCSELIPYKNCIL